VSLTSIGGSASITQGGGASDVATILGTGTTVASGTIGGNATIGQGDGAGDVAVIAYLTIGGSIGITQGNGNSDAAEIETILSTGGTVKAPITIGITQGNGNKDVAAIVNLTATGGSTGAGATLIFIHQGSGNWDWAEIANVTAIFANVEIIQTDVAANSHGDVALVINTNVGFVNPDGTDFNNTGNVTITQGDAGGDIALVEGSSDDTGTANNITITQGLGFNPLTFNGSTTLQGTDVAEINDETVTSNITITQGNANSLGFFVTAIGFDFVGMAGLSVSPPAVPPQFTPLVTPSVGDSPVTAGGTTAILQFGANNVVLLGAADSSFMTDFLDVYTGAGGGAFVQVLNTTTFGVAPLGGPFSSIYNIEGGGTGNSIYMDVLSSFSVTFDPAAFFGFIG